MSPAIFLPSSYSPMASSSLVSNWVFSCSMAPVTLGLLNTLWVLRMAWSIGTWFATSVCIIALDRFSGKLPILGAWFTDLFFKRIRVLNSYFAEKFHLPVLKSMPRIGVNPNPVWSQLNSMLAASVLVGSSTW